MPDQLDEATIQAELAICDAATEGDWRAKKGRSPIADTGDYDETAELWCGDDCLIILWNPSDQCFENLKFIAHARTNYPRALRELLDKMKQLADVQAERDGVRQAIMGNGQCGDLVPYVQSVVNQLSDLQAERDAAIAEIKDASEMERELLALRAKLERVGELASRMTVLSRPSDRAAATLNEILKECGRE